MDLISPLSCSSEDRPYLPAAREALVVELERRGKVALAALLPVLVLLWAVLRNAVQADHRLSWLLVAVLLAALLRMLPHRWRAKTPGARHLWFTIGSTTVALLLGATIILAFPRLSAIEAGLVGMIAAGLGSGALISMSPSPVTYLAYLWPIVGALGFASWRTPVPEHPHIFQALACLFLVGLSGLCMEVHRSLRSGILLQLRSQDMALRDTLTGLHNRRFLSEFMEPETAQALRSWNRGEANSPTLKLIMLDLDHFKEVNDVHGHDAGDAVLKQLADLLRDTLRKPDLVVRWGGEEFVIIARNTGRTLPLGLAERIRRRVAEHPFLLPDGSTLRKTCSLGFALFPFAPETPEAIAWEQCLALADSGLYLAKAEGRNRWVGLEAARADWTSEEAYQALRADPASSEGAGIVRLVREDP